HPAARARAPPAHGGSVSGGTCGSGAGGDRVRGGPDTRHTGPGCRVLRRRIGARWRVDSSGMCMTGPRVAIVTFGCKVNTYDSASIGERLRGAGCTLVEDGAPHDVLVVNSCTVTDAACSDVRRL